MTVGPLESPFLPEFPPTYKVYISGQFAWRVHTLVRRW